MALDHQLVGSDLFVRRDNANPITAQPHDHSLSREPDPAGGALR